MKTVIFIFSAMLSITSCGINVDDLRDSDSNLNGQFLNGASNKRFLWGDYAGRTDDWFRSGEAKEIAEAVITWQFGSGGWYKENHQRKKRKEDLPDKSATIDNGATTSQLYYLLRFQRLNGSNSKISKSIDKGINFLLKAQLDIGGWPQVYPADGSYRDNSTFNDNAIVNVLYLFNSIFAGESKGMLDAGKEEQVKAAFYKGIDYIKKSQVISQGKRTAWCQQYDPKKIKCVKGRSYELPGISGSESVSVVRLLQAFDPEGSKDIINSAIEWFKKVAIRDKAWNGSVNKGRPTDQAGSTIWARYYDLETQTPFFSGRDGKKTTDIGKIEKERREGYAWYGDWAKDLVGSGGAAPGGAGPVVTDPVHVDVAGVTFRFASAGPIAGMNCTHLNETSDPHTWNDNYLCASTNLGLRFNSAGPIGGMKCTHLNETSDLAGSWGDNYLCLPNGSDYNLSFAAAGKPAGKMCLSMYERSEPAETTWWDNFLCVEKVKASADTVSLRFSHSGTLGGMHCTSMNEPSDPHTWNDNYLCSNENLGMKFATAGATPGMDCTRIHEGSDIAGTWGDNYMCLPKSSKVRLHWSSAGPIAGKACIAVNEPAEPAETTWSDNFICIESK